MLIGAFIPVSRIVYIAEPQPVFAKVIEIVDDFVEEKVCESIYDYGCSCMLGLRSIGYAVEGLDAKDLQVNATEGTTGDLILFYYPTTDIYHASVIKATFPSGNFLVWECNFIPGTCGERVVMQDDSAIRGYLHKVK